MNHVVYLYEAPPWGYREMRSCLRVLLPVARLRDDEIESIWLSLCAEIPETIL